MNRSNHILPSTNPPNSKPNVSPAQRCSPDSSLTSPPAAICAPPIPDAGSITPRGVHHIHHLHHRRPEYVPTHSRSRVDHAARRSPDSSLTSPPAGICAPRIPDPGTIPARGLHRFHHLHPCSCEWGAGPATQHSPPPPRAHPHSKQWPMVERPDLCETLIRFETPTRSVT